MAYGDLLGWCRNIYVKIALPADDWCFFSLEMTALCEFGDKVFDDLSKGDAVELFVAGRNLQAEVTSKGADGKIYLNANHVLAGLAGSPVEFRRAQIAKGKKVRRNG